MEQRQRLTSATSGWEQPAGSNPVVGKTRTRCFYFLSTQHNTHLPRLRAVVPRSTRGGSSGRDSTVAVHRTCNAKVPSSILGRGLVEQRQRRTNVQVPERSKGLVLGTSVFALAGSNPVRLPTV